MATASSRESLEDMLSEPVDRENFQALVERIYDSYTSVDLTHNRIKQMATKLEKASGDQERDLAEKIGILRFAMGQYEEAVEALDAVRTRKTAAYFLGRALLELNRQEEAIEYLERGRQDEQDIESDTFVIDALCRLRREEEAEELLEKYGEPEEPSADLHYGRARVAEARGDYAEAMEHYEAGLEIQPEHARCLFRLALNCDLNGDDERAIELYRRCVNLRPTYVGALINLGVLCEDHGEFEEAIDCYKRVLAINPHHKQAQLYLKDAESSLNMYIDIGKARRRQRLEEIFSLPVANFELSARSRSCLDRMDIKTLGGLTKVTRDQLLNEKNFGDTSLGEIEVLLSRYDLELGEEVPEGQDIFKTPDEQAEEKLEMPVEELEFSTRGRRCMDRLGIKTVGQLVQMTDKQLLECPNFGSTSLNEVKSKLAELGLSLKSE